MADEFADALSAQDQPTPYAGHGNEQHTHDTGRDADGYVPLRDYGAIGDGRSVGLVALDGDIDWLPLPGMADVPAFSALLDAPLGGRLSLRPDIPFTSTREYVEGTNVLATTFHTEQGTVRITDSLNVGIAGRLPWSELARRIDGIDGEVPMRAVFAPGTAFRSASPWLHDTVHGLVFRLDGLTLAVRSGEGTDVDVDIPTSTITITFTTGKDSRHIVGLVATADEPLFLPDPDVLDEGIDRTIEAWRTWLSQCSTGETRWKDQVHRSALALKLLLYSPTGAVAAAATTSLPESTTKDKNWDYRYAWVRDTAYALRALFRFGLREETHAAISWMLEKIRQYGPAPHIFYTLDGGLPDAEETITPAPGYRNLGPVKNGNGAADQLQMGIYGDLFSIVRRYVDHGHVLDTPTGRSLAHIADLAADQWRNPDAGMWELHEDEHFTTSKLGAWEALDGAAKLAEMGQIPGDPDRWRTEADRIRHWVEENCWDEEQRAYVWYPGTDELDTSILLHAISGFDRGERMSSTIDALRAKLGVGPWLYRYSGMDQEEGAFVACSFWMANALHLCGRQDEAIELMEQLLPSDGVAAVNDVGLMTEMIDPTTGEFVGNMPQALSHLALLNAAITIDGAEDV